MFVHYDTVLFYSLDPSAQSSSVGGIIGGVIGAIVVLAVVLVVVVLVGVCVARHRKQVAQNRRYSSMLSANTTRPASMALDFSAHVGTEIALSEKNDPNVNSNDTSIRS